MMIKSKQSNQLGLNLKITSFFLLLYSTCNLLLCVLLQFHCEEWWIKRTIFVLCLSKTIRLWCNSHHRTLATAFLTIKLWHVKPSRYFKNLRRPFNFGMTIRHWSPIKHINYWYMYKHQDIFNLAYFYKSSVTSRAKPYPLPK